MGMLAQAAACSLSLLLCPSSGQDIPAHELTSKEGFSSFGWERGGAGRPLDVSGFVLTFEDEFSSLSSIAQDTESADSAGAKVKWFSPGHGAARRNGWVGPKDRPDIYAIGAADGVTYLSISQVWDERTSRWLSGCIQSVDKKGKGFAQEYGYFEARMRFPDASRQPVAGLWPAFWTYTVNRYTAPAERMVEYDVLEAYGGPPDARTNRQPHSTVHVVPPSGGDPSLPKRMYRSMAPTQAEPLFDGKWHTYGGLVTPRWTVTYVDRKEVGRFPTVPEAKRPRYLLVDLDDKKDLAQPGPYAIDVDRVSVWRTPRDYDGL
jgi:hypothetical protein